MRVELHRRAKVVGVRPRQPFFFAILAANGERIAQSEMYSNKADALDTARLIVGEEERVAAELDEARRRLRALDLAIRQAEADFGVRLAEIRAGWTAELDQRMTAARSELGKALGRATAARQGVQDLDNVLIWLEGWPAGSYTPFAGRVPGVANERGNVLTWPQVLDALGVAAG